jgi:hypothetical protein
MLRQELHFYCDLLEVSFIPLRSRLSVDKKHLDPVLGQRELSNVLCLQHRGIVMDGYTFGESL